ncbi:hypothetical protein H8B13_15580 [Hymenobacter sp. BT188]|uniref:hypothetical protein n=1 Tax=Hymenobacter sp. BT188 TaxID=2763504 RepID=UPI001651A264|nr:hypothetical protein [Hymenobacter sp. BT188]MBC6608249.1 hypothetical protein [Hymenobacter sp. BT188]
MRIVRLWRVGLMVFLGATFFTSGMAKLYAGHHFPGWIGPVWLIEKLQAYQLGMYAAFIALSQVITGFLLLTRRFWLLGAIALMPMLLNILLITISQKWAGTPYVIGVMLLMDMALLLSEYRRLRVLWTDEPYVPRSGSQPSRTLVGHLMWSLGLVLVIAAILVSYQTLSLSYWLVCGGLLLAWFSFLADRLRSVATFLPPSAS